MVFVPSAHRGGYGAGKAPVRWGQEEWPMRTEAARWVEVWSLAEMERAEREAWVMLGFRDAAD